MIRYGVYELRLDNGDHVVSYVNETEAHFLLSYPLSVIIDGTSIDLIQYMPMSSNKNVPIHKSKVSCMMESDAVSIGRYHEYLTKLSKGSNQTQMDQNSTLHWFSISIFPQISLFYIYVQQPKFHFVDHKLP